MEEYKIKKTLLALLAILAIHQIAQSYDMCAISYDGTVEDLADMDNPLNDDEIDKFLKNDPSSKLGTLGDSKLYLHAWGDVTFGKGMYITDSYIQNDNGVITVYYSWVTLDGGSKIQNYADHNDTKEYAKVLITKDTAEDNGWSEMPSLLYSQSAAEDGSDSILYLKIKQNSTDTDACDATYYNPNNPDLPLGLEGYEGTAVHPDDLFIPIYVK